MAADLKRISATSYIVRRHYSSPRNLGETFTQAMSSKLNQESGLSLFPRRDSWTPPIAYEVTRKFPDSMRAPSQSRDRSSLSVDRQMYTRGYSQPPTDRVLRQSRARMAINSHCFKYSWFRYWQLYIYVRILVWENYV